jgi:hypothetical protein
VSRSLTRQFRGRAGTGGASEFDLQTGFLQDFARVLDVAFAARGISAGDRIVDQGGAFQGGCQGSFRFPPSSPRSGTGSR